MSQITTPFEREVLTHFYVAPRDTEYRSWLQNRNTPLYQQTVQRFIRAGLLRLRVVDEGGVAIGVGGVVVGVDDALKAYFDALGRVPLPVSRTVSQWVVPEPEAG